MNLLSQTILENWNNILAYGEKGAWGRKGWEPVVYSTDW
jgi:hypothetical protein